MNLLKTLKQEISDLQITDKMTIARYIYTRTGEIFDYDPFYEISDNEEKDRIAHKRIDIENVTEFDIVCTTWAYLYVDLLKFFYINAKVKYCNPIFKSHPTVFLEIDKKIVLVDLMLGFEDISGIKFGYSIRHNLIQGSDFLTKAEEMDAAIKYNKGIKTEEVLELIKKELIDLKLDPDEYKYKVFKTIEKIMSFPRSNVRFISGAEYIFQLLRDFSIKLQGGYATFYNKEKKEFIAVYFIELEEKPVYFIYQKNENGLYEFHEVTEERINALYDNYSASSDFFLKRVIKKNE